MVESVAERYSSRIPKRERHQTLVAEILDTATQRQYVKRRYAAIQQKHRADPTKTKFRSNSAKSKSIKAQSGRPSHKRIKLSHSHSDKK